MISGCVINYVDIIYKKDLTKLTNIDIFHKITM